MQIISSKEEDYIKRKFNQKQSENHKDQTVASLRGFLGRWRGECGEGLRF